MRSPASSLSSSQSLANEKTVVLVGGGHAHVQILRRWAMKPPPGARLLVVLDQAVAVYSGMVPGFVSGDYAESDLEIDIVPLARRAGAGVLFSAATDIDPVRKEISLEGRPPIRYDLTSLDVGSTIRGLDLEGVRDGALTTRPIGHFVRALVDRIEPLRALDRPPRIGLVGGGAAGCEIAFALETRLRVLGLRPEIKIITQGFELLPGAAPRLRNALNQEASKRGIEALLRRRVLRIEAGHVVSEAALDTPDSDLRSDPFDLIVWATGAAPVRFPAHEGVGRLATDGRGFIEVRDTLQAVGFDDVFAVGDCAQLVNHRWVPKAGVYSVRQGPVLDHNLRAALRNTPMRDYRPQRDFLSLLNLGEGRALGGKWGMAVSGSGVFSVKDWIDRRFMDRFQILDAEGRVRPSNAKLGAMGTGADGEPEEEMACGGCAAKLGASPLAAALAALPKSPTDDSVLLGLDARDDVAATLNPNADGTQDNPTLHNIDVIRSFCDDPWLVGRVAASNALSDLHAKGGRPKHAQAVIGLPDLPALPAQELLFQALSGLRSILDDEGVSLLGGHTTIGDALTVGLSVSGPGPDEATLMRQAGARIGDALLLTQPLGTGVVLAADMQGRARGAWVQAAHQVMQHTNGRAGSIALESRAHAATDVTGFGFAGHLLTLLDPDALVARINRNAIPLLPGAHALWAEGLRSTAHPPNREAFMPSVSDASEADEAWLFDPQTAGGLLIAVAPQAVDALQAELEAAGEPETFVIGEIVESGAQNPGQGGKKKGRIDLAG